MLHWPTPTYAAPAAWAAATGQSLPRLAADFARDGFVVVRGIIWPAGLEVYRSIHERLMSGERTTPGWHDLGSYAERKVAGAENVGQIMWPSDLAANARKGPLHQRGYAIAAAVMGDEAAFDFDMLIWKEAHTDTETPWHQDIAYWPAGMADTRALTV